MCRHYSPAHWAPQTLHDCGGGGIIGQVYIAWLELPGGKEEVTEITKGLKDSEAWWKRVEEKVDLFSDPVILGASVAIFAPNMDISLGVKEYEKPSGSLPLSGRGSGVDSPTTRLLFAGARFLVEYENRFLDASGKERGYRMILDLDRLEEN